MAGSVKRPRALKFRCTETMYQQIYYISRVEEVEVSDLLREALARMLKARAKTLYGQLPESGVVPPKNEE